MPISRSYFRVYNTLLKCVRNYPNRTLYVLNYSKLFLIWSAFLKYFPDFSFSCVCLSFCVILVKCCVKQSKQKCVNQHSLWFSQSSRTCATYIFCARMHYKIDKREHCLDFVTTILPTVIFENNGMPHIWGSWAQLTNSKVNTSRFSTSRVYWSVKLRSVDDNVV